MDFDWLEWPNRINKYIENSALQFDLIDLGMCTVLPSDLQKNWHILEHLLSKSHWRTKTSATACVNAYFSSSGFISTTNGWIYFMFDMAWHLELTCETDLCSNGPKSYFSPHSPSHMLQRPTSQTSYIPSLTSSAFKSTFFLRQKHSKGSFCLPAAASCQNTQVAAMSTINMMYSLCGATDLTTRTEGVRGSRCHVDLWHSARTFTLCVLSCPSEQRVRPVMTEHIHSSMTKQHVGEIQCECKICDCLDALS